MTDLLKIDGSGNLLNAEELIGNEPWMDSEAGCICCCFSGRKIRCFLPEATSFVIKEIDPLDWKKDLYSKVWGEVYLFQTFHCADDLTRYSLVPTEESVFLDKQKKEPIEGMVGTWRMNVGYCRSACRHRTFIFEEKISDRSAIYDSSGNHQGSL